MRVQKWDKILEYYVGTKFGIKFNKATMSKDLSTIDSNLRIESTTESILKYLDVKNPQKKVG